MVKRVLGGLKKLLPVSLVLIGWLSFFVAIGYADIPLTTKILLLTVARVLR